MADRGITFSAAMVRALLDGSKTQTRRLLNPQPSDYRCASNPPAIGNVKKHAKPYFDRYHKGPFWCWWDEYDRQGPDWIRVPHAIGDRLYVLEHWKTGVGNDGVAPRDLDPLTSIRFLADDSEAGKYPITAPLGRHRQAMHMPRWASRLWLSVTDVRVQRLQDISEADAAAEGVALNEREIEANEALMARDLLPHIKAISDKKYPLTAKTKFAVLWNRLHETEGTRWEDNPYIYAVNFDVVLGNIDQIGVPNG
jgi:hypothetical protein